MNFVENLPTLIVDKLAVMALSVERVEKLSTIIVDNPYASV